MKELPTGYPQEPDFCGNIKALPCSELWELVTSNGFFASGSFLSKGLLATLEAFFPSTS